MRNVWGRDARDARRKNLASELTVFIDKISLLASLKNSERRHGHPA